LNRIQYVIPRAARGQIAHRRGPARLSLAETAAALGQNCRRETPRRSSEMRARQIDHKQI
jgi:hypothetical protein